MLNFLWWVLIVDLLSSVLVEARQLNWLHKFILLLTMAKKLQPLRRLMIASSKQPKLFRLCCYEMKHFILVSRAAAWFGICLNFIRQHNLSLFQLQPPPCIPSTNPRLVYQFRSNKVQRVLQHMKLSGRPLPYACCQGLLCVWVTNQSWELDRRSG